MWAKLPDDKHKRPYHWFTPVMRTPRRRGLVIGSDVPTAISLSACARDRYEMRRTPPEARADELQQETVANLDFRCLACRQKLSPYPEAALVDIAATTLATYGWTCLREVGFAGDRTRIDLLAVHKGGTILAIEAKLVYGERVLRQAADRWGTAHYLYVLVPTWQHSTVMHSERLAAVCDAQGIGVLMADTTGMWEVVRGRFQGEPLTGIHLQIHRQLVSQEAA